MDIIEQIDDMYDHHTQQEVEQFMLEKRDQLLMDPEGVADLIAVCNELGALYREQSRYEESADNFERALKYTEGLAGTKLTDEYGILLINVAGTYRYKRDFAKAMEYYEEAHDIFEKLGKGGTFEFASLLNNMSNTYQDLGNTDKAYELASAAYEIIEKLAAGQTEEAVSLMNLASIALRKGDLEKASEYSKKALGIYDALNNRSGHYPAAVNLAAVVAFQKGDYEDALKGFQHSAELSLNHFGENRDYASALANVAVALEKLGRTEEAKETLAKAEKVKASLK